MFPSILLSFLIPMVVFWGYGVGLFIEVGSEIVSVDFIREIIMPAVANCLPFYLLCDKSSYVRNRNYKDMIVAIPFWVTYLVLIIALILMLLNSSSFYLIYIWSVPFILTGVAIATYWIMAGLVWLCTAVRKNR